MMADTNKFKIVKNGYSKLEVEECVSRLTNELEQSRAQVENYRRLSDQANEQLSLIKERYNELNSRIEIREKAAEDISRLALREANQIIGSAQTNADSIVQEALVTARTILLEIARLSNEASGMKEEMQEKIQELQKTLDEFNVPAAIDEKWLQD